MGRPKYHTMTLEGKRWKVVSVEYYKANAKIRATKWRKKGYNARVIASGLVGKWMVIARKGRRH